MTTEEIGAIARKEKRMRKKKAKWHTPARYMYVGQQAWWLLTLISNGHLDSLVIKRTFWAHFVFLYIHISTLHFTYNLSDSLFWDCSTKLILWINRQSWDIGKWKLGPRWQGSTDSGRDWSTKVSVQSDVLTHWASAFHYCSRINFVRLSPHLTCQVSWCKTTVEFSWPHYFRDKLGLRQN